jgi:hypothetical protein
VSFRRFRSVLVAAVAVVAAAVAAIILNVVLLGWSSQKEPVGRLTARVGLPAPPAWAIRPTAGPIEDSGADD